jgi:hypothetical protein
MGFLDFLKEKRVVEKDFGASFEKNSEIENLEKQQQELDNKLRNAIEKQQESAAQLKNTLEFNIGLRVTTKQQYMDVKQFELYMAEQYGIEVLVSNACTPIIEPDDTSSASGKTKK